MDKVIYASAENISEIIKEKGLVFVDFFATWCGPCKMLAPTIDKLAELYDGKVKVVKADVDICEAEAIKMGISSVPTMKLFRDGELLESLVGLVPLTKIQSIIDKHI